MLQIKNKSNSENSSSSNIRSGTNIEKWYRLGTKNVAGEKVPVYKWDDLNNLIESASGFPCNLSEEDYVKYVEEVATNNPDLITDQ
ncbi:MAG: SinI family restriction endonuclease [Peptococcaceae bacterium]|nr:SinI family restriction endonuclease [Peptococcaceae bacterium]